MHLTKIFKLYTSDINIFSILFMIEFKPACFLESHFRVKASRNDICIGIGTLMHHVVVASLALYMHCPKANVHFDHALINSCLLTHNFIKSTSSYFSYTLNFVKPCFSFASGYSNQHNILYLIHHCLGRRSVIDCSHRLNH